MLIEMEEKSASEEISMWTTKWNGNNILQTLRRTLWMKILWTKRAVLGLAEHIIKINQIGSSPHLFDFSNASAIYFNFLHSADDN